MTDYSNIPFRIIGFPPPERLTGGAWRTTWPVTYTPSQAAIPAMPPIPDALPALAVVIAVVVEKPGELRVELVSNSEGVRPRDVAYVSIVFQTLAQAFNSIEIDGHEDHPILRLTDLSDDAE